MEQAAGWDDLDELRKQEVGKIRSDLHKDRKSVRPNMFPLDMAKPSNFQNDLLTFCFKDHHISKFTLSLLIETLHLDVIGGLRLQVGDRVPVSVSLHHILLIVTVIIAVRWSVVDVETVDGRVVYRSVLLRWK